MPSDNLTARMQFEQGRQAFATSGFDQAAEHFKKAVTIDPKYKEAHRYLAESYEKLGYRHRAKKVWEGLLRISSSDESGDVKRRIDDLS